MQRILFAMLCIAFQPVTTPADLIFRFTESGGDVLMTSSGVLETANLVPGTLTTFFGTGIENSTSYSIMGNGEMTSNLDTALTFNAGTDFSEWLAGSPWTRDFFAWRYTGSKQFSTGTADGPTGIQPGFLLAAADMVGSTWSPDDSWRFSGGSFASLGLNIGEYTVSDAVTGESITYLITNVPEPSGLTLLGLTSVFVYCKRRRK